MYAAMSRVVESILNVIAIEEGNDEKGVKSMEDHFECVG